MFKTCFAYSLFSFSSIVFYIVSYVITPRSFKHSQ